MGRSESIRKLYCGTCSVGLHTQCITLASPDAVCLCAAEGHTAEMHPALKRVAHRTQRRAPVSGAMREIDYELEPYEVRGPGGVSETHSTKSAPRDDIQERN